MPDAKTGRNRDAAIDNASRGQKLVRSHADFCRLESCRPSPLPNPYCPSVYGYQFALFRSVQTTQIARSIPGNGVLQNEKAAAATGGGRAGCRTNFSNDRRVAASRIESNTSQLIGRSLWQRDSIPLNGLPAEGKRLAGHAGNPLPGGRRITWVTASGVAAGEEQEESAEGRKSRRFTISGKISALRVSSRSASIATRRPIPPRLPDVWGAGSLVEGSATAVTPIVRMESVVIFRLLADRPAA